MGAGRAGARWSADCIRSRVVRGRREQGSSPGHDTRTGAIMKESKVEAAKREGRRLRGTIAEQLHDGGSHFEGDDVTLLKFHGTYQQDDRDARKRRDESAEKAYAFMVRVALPAGALDAEQYLALAGGAERRANGTPPGTPPP